jgi:hypothetical protein
MLSFLRWESGSMAAAHDNIMRAERISRSADPAERAVALSQAAKCLLLLERDMALAESFLMEAEALVSRGALSPSALSFASGMMNEHRGELENARIDFIDARQIGRQQGDRLAEFSALEHLMMLELDRRAFHAAAELADDLVALSERVRTGPEQACARALRSLATRACEQDNDCAELRGAIDELRQADSKYRLAFALTRFAELELQRDNFEGAHMLATKGLQVATDIRRASEIARAHLLLAKCASHDGDTELFAHHLQALRELRESDLSAASRTQLEAFISEHSS